MEILPLTGGDRDVLDVLSQRLRAGRLVPLLADRDLRASGVEVQLLGEPTRMPPGPAMLALRTGAALHPVSIWHEPVEARRRPRLVIRFHDEVPRRRQGTTREKVTAMTQAGRRRVRRRDRRAPRGLAHAAAALAGRPRPGAAPGARSATP